MVNSSVPCVSAKANKNKTWLYEQYYSGDRDDDQRRHGVGINSWTGAKSLESYKGEFTCDTMHGAGEYRWRHGGDDGAPYTYEGYFYNNNMHGYGLLSFPDGRTFRGLFNQNQCWGPGIQTHVTMREDVGLWQGTRLIRLAWKPSAATITPDFTSTAVGRATVEKHRRLLTTRTRVIGETNSAIDLLKECGAKPTSALERWSKLYPKDCTDLASPLCNIDRFEKDYYKADVKTILKEVKEIPYFDNDSNSQNSHDIRITYFAWNNNNIIIDMMKNSYQHEMQRDKTQIDLMSLLSGPRSTFKSAAKHETDSRALLLTSYLGYLVNVAQLINKENVYPNVSDVQGNNTVMYATCGDQVDLIRFLVEAGAHIDDYNDSCCTPLAVALMRYACAINDVPPNLMLQALLPPPAVPATTYEESRVLEWNMSRDQSYQNITTAITKSPSKSVRTASSKKIKSLMSIKDQTTAKRKTEIPPVKPPEPAYDSDDSLSGNRQLYNDANREYTIKFSDIFINANVEVPYLFEVTDMVMEIDSMEETPKKALEKNAKKVPSRIIKDTVKTSKVILGQSKENVEGTSETTLEKHKTNMLAKVKLTILELLTNGANPTLVRCPQPALVIAIFSNSPDLIKHLVHCGVDVNEVYPQIHGYTPLDIAVSRKLTWENLEVIRALLESGANARRSIYYEHDSSDITVVKPQSCGPTLLHAVLAKKLETDAEEEIRRHLIDLLLNYNCNPITQFKGRSAIDLVMTKYIDLFDVFIHNSKTNLNLIINDVNQSVLVKMFWSPYFKSNGSTERFQTLTNLLACGADPLLPCENGQDKYKNIFVFARKTLREMENVNPGKESVAKDDTKVKKPEKPKKDDKLSMKSIGKMVADDKEDYKQAIELVTECARLLHIRWLQGKLVKELIWTIQKFRHRPWNMILNECKNKKCIGLWISPLRGIEIWTILSSTKKKMYCDNRVLKHLLSIITFLAWRFYNPQRNEFTPGSKVTAVVKDLIAKDVNFLLKEYKKTKQLAQDMSWKSSYVKPELDNDNKKFNICFECAMPLNEDKMKCSICKIVYFCTLDCLCRNIERANCHPCSDDLRNKYFPETDRSFRDSVTGNII